LRNGGKSLEWLKGLEKSNWDATYKSEWGDKSAGDMFASWIAHDNLAIRQFVELRTSSNRTNYEPYAIEYAGDW